MRYTRQPARMVRAGVKIFRAQNKSEEKKWPYVKTDHIVRVFYKHICYESDFSDVDDVIRVLDHLAGCLVNAPGHRWSNKI